MNWNEASNRRDPGSDNFGTISCVVDGEGDFCEQAVRWFVSLTRICNVPAGNLQLLTVDAEHRPELKWLQSQGVQLHPTTAFDTHCRNCNKIQAMNFFATLPRMQRVVLSDCDIVFLQDPRRHASADRSLSAKPVDLANPPLSMLREILRAAGLEAPPTMSSSFSTDDDTLRGNANGGLHITDSDTARELAPVWSRWAKWLIREAFLLDYGQIFVDQVAMMLTLIETGILFDELKIEWNYPTHLPLPADVMSPKALHYHRCVEPNGRLSPTGADNVDAAIDLINTALGDAAQAPDFPLSW